MTEIAINVMPQEPPITTLTPRIVLITGGSRGIGLAVAEAYAGNIRPTPFLEITETQWDNIVDASLKGTFLFLQAVGWVMVRRGSGGSMITVSSPSAQRASTEVADYSAAKGGVIALTRCVAKELQPHGVRVNCVIPVAEMRMTDALRAARGPMDPRPAPESLVGSFRFFGSPGATTVTGQVLTVDAGRWL